jgi:hypothetical protein
MKYSTILCQKYFKAPLAKLLRKRTEVKHRCRLRSDALIVNNFSFLEDNNSCLFSLSLGYAHLAATHKVKALQVLDYILNEKRGEKPEQKPEKEPVAHKVHNMKMSREVG